MWAGHEPPDVRCKLLACSKAMLTAADAVVVVAHLGLDCDAAYELDYELLDNIAWAC